MIYLILPVIIRWRNFHARRLIRWVGFGTAFRLTEEEVVADGVWIDGQWRQLIETELFLKMVEEGVVGRLNYHSSPPGIWMQVPYSLSICATITNPPRGGTSARRVATGPMNWSVRKMSGHSSVIVTSPWNDFAASLSRVEDIPSSALLWDKNW